MRRSVALLCLLALANFTVVRDGFGCQSMASGTHAAGATDHSHHAAAPVSDGDEAVSTAPESHDPAPACLTMAHCTLTLAAAEPVATGVAPTPGSRVPPGLFARLRSQSAAPELPPPRA